MLLRPDRSTLRRRARTGGVLATAALLALSVAGAASPSAAVAGADGKDQRAQSERVRIDSVPVGSRVDGVKVDGSRETAAERAEPRAQRESFTPRATEAPRAAYQMPFRCGETWVGSTRSSHSPSTLSVDWNRTDDFDMPVVASAAGTVTTASSTTSGYGKWVVVDHGNGDSTLYAHLNSIAVRVGQKVPRGQMVGRLGTTGNSTGPHLHYEQRRNGSVVHPFFDGVQFRFNTSLTSKNCAEPEPPAQPPAKPLAGDVPLAGNVVDGPEDDPVRWRRSDPARYEAERADGTTRTTVMGGLKDQPVLGDWTGDGRANPGYFRPSTRTFRLRSPEGRQTIRFGYKGSIPLAGDWDGDGVDEIGVWRPAIGRFDLRGAEGGVFRSIVMGESDQLPFVGDWNGDGRADVGVYDRDTRTFTLRTPRGKFRSFVHGPAGGLPIAGDWDGDGQDELGTWDPATGAFDLRGD
ncbi:hypothetical protein GCM10009737_09890 [Nocardioides lentus]|uniref:M23ase beta-sheet core domain-containing protein n=1 Tax=Nocardioides lentus TaxID=338077 RepID=A0ABP5AFT8_9ACTN